MKVITYPAGDLMANNYIVFDEETSQGVIIDAGDDCDKIMDICKQNSLQIQYIILTHGHFDHIGAVCDLKEATGAKVLMSKQDEFLLINPPADLKIYYNDIKSFDVDGFIKENDKIEFGSSVFEIIDTPGHTPGGICIKLDNYIFSGDTLFRDSIGRTDFMYGDFIQLMNSIKNKLFVYDDNTVVYPGHGPSTTLGHEKIYNSFLLNDFE